MTTFTRVPTGIDSYTVTDKTKQGGNTVITLNTTETVITGKGCKLTPGTEVDIYRAGTGIVQVIASAASTCLKNCKSLDSCPGCAGTNALEPNTKYPVFVESYEI